MADYPRMQKAMNEVRIQLKESLEQIGESRGGNDDGAAMNRGSQESDFLVHKKVLRVDNFHGDEGKFGDFIEETKIYADCMMPIIGDAVDWIELQEKTMLEATIINKFGHNLNRVNRVISGFLKVKLKGKAAVWLKSQPNGEGVRTWKAMLNKYDPLTGSTRLDLHNKITAAPTRSAALRDVPAAIERWESDYKKYLFRAGKEVDDEMKQNIILRFLPAKTEAYLRMKISLNARETTYATLRQQIVDMSVHAAGGVLATPMDAMPLEFPIDDEEVKYTFEEWNEWQGAWPEYAEDAGKDKSLDALQRKGGKGGKAKGKGKTKGQGLGGKGCEKGKGWDQWVERPKC